MWEQLQFKLFSQTHEYMPLNLLPKASVNVRAQTAIKIAIGMCALLVLVSFISPLSPVTAARDYGLFNQVSNNDPIPSIVHYVYIKKDEHSVIQFPFSSFLTLFAAVMYISPTKIYIHTDYNQTEIEHAAKKGDLWTRKLMNSFPELVTWNHVQAPNYAGPNEDQRISAIQHKSDFIRWDTIAGIGGIYMDWDVVTLRPLTPLLNTGFAFIGGRQYGGKDEGGAINGTINNGAFMTKSNSTMARIIVREQHAGFNGAWASNLQSMTRAAEILVSIPNQVLILDRNAFAPTHWFAESTDALFRTHEGRPSPEPLPLTSHDPLVNYNTAVQNRRVRTEWEMDFSSSYMLHAFATGRYQNFINPDIILSRTSNYGVATYSIVKEMKNRGLFNETIVHGH